MNLFTRRFPTILGIFLLILIAAGGWWWLSTHTTQVATELVPTKVRITNVADNKFTVSWITSKAVEGYVEYGKVGETLSTIAYDDRNQNNTPLPYQTHHVTISSLQPMTQYAFRIISGSAKNRFDNNGSPYSVTTGPTIAETPVAHSIYGDIGGTSGSAMGSIVYLTLPGSTSVSTLVTSGNNYSFSISTIRSSDLTKYIEYDPSATVASLTVENGGPETVVTVSTANAEPVPKILIGQNADYRSQVPPVAQVEPTSNPGSAPSSTPSASPTAQTPGIFNVEPLSGSSQNTTSVVLLNPSTDGETIATTKPEFRGTGPATTVVSLSVHSTAVQTSNVTIAQDGTWSWTPPKSLTAGQHTLTLSYIDSNGHKQTVTRSFLVSPALAAEGDPAFVSTPSATTASPSPSTKASPKASVVASPSPTSITESGDTLLSPSPREVIPSTESGIPVTGVLTPTLLTGALGFVIMIAGAVMLAL